MLFPFFFSSQLNLFLSLFINISSLPEGYFSRRHQVHEIFMSHQISIPINYSYSNHVVLVVNLLVDNSHYIAPGSILNYLFFLMLFPSSLSILLLSLISSTLLHFTVKRSSHQEVLIPLLSSLNNEVFSNFLEFRPSLLHHFRIENMLIHSPNNFFPHNVPWFLLIIRFCQKELTQFILVPLNHFLFNLNLD